MLKLDSVNRVRYMVYPDFPVTPPLRFGSLGQHCIDFHSYNWDGRRRSGKGGAALVQYTLRGRGAVDFDGQSYPVGPGQAMLLVFPENHRYYLPDDSGYWEVLYVNLSGYEAVRMLRELRSAVGPVATLGTDSAAMELAASVLLRGNRLETPCEAGVEACRFLLTLSDEALQSGRSSRMPEFVGRVVRFCREHPDGELSVDSLAAIAGCSRSHFSREFKRATGVSPLEMVNTLRFKLAIQLLMGSNFSVKEIAGRCGFDDTSYFVRAFGQRFGTSPGEFRRARLSEAVALDLTPLSGSGLEPTDSGCGC